MAFSALAQLGVARHVPSPFNGERHGVVLCLRPSIYLDDVRKPLIGARSLPAVSAAAVSDLAEGGIHPRTYDLHQGSLGSLRDSHRRCQPKRIARTRRTGSLPGTSPRVSMWDKPTAIGEPGIWDSSDTDSGARPYHDVSALSERTLRLRSLASGLSDQGGGAIRVAVVVHPRSRPRGLVGVARPPPP